MENLVARGKDAREGGVAILVRRRANVAAKRAELQPINFAGPIDLAVRLDEERPLPNATQILDPGRTALGRCLLIDVADGDGFVCLHAYS